MQAKLTLSLDNDVIEQAKDFSRRQHKSLSKMIENYLRLVTRMEAGTEEITPVVASLLGAVSMDVEGKGRKEITSYMEEKHR